MELFIQIRNDQPFEHPILGDNFRQAFPHIDCNNLPPEFARFERIERPEIQVYEIYEGVTYEKDGDIYKDVHHVRAMTPEEKTAKQNHTIQNWMQHGYASWIFDEHTCSFQPPAPYPEDGKVYRWDEAITNWVEVIFNQGV